MVFQWDDEKYSAPDTEEEEPTCCVVCQAAYEQKDPGNPFEIRCGDCQVKFRMDGNPAKPKDMSWIDFMAMFKPKVRSMYDY